MKNYVVLGLVWSGAVYAQTPAVPATDAGSATAAATSAGAAAAAAAPQQPGLFGMLFPFLAMFGVIYFMMIRPQQKKMKEQQDMLGALKDGDQVVTTSGVLGTVKGITDKIVTLEIDKNVQIKMLKSQVAQVLKGQGIKELA